MIELALQQVVNGLLVGASYAVMALGLMVILGILNVINMAQGELYIPRAMWRVGPRTRFDMILWGGWTP